MDAFASCNACIFGESLRLQLTTKTYHIEDQNKTNESFASHCRFCSQFRLNYVVLFTSSIVVLRAGPRRRREEDMGFVMVWFFHAGESFPVASLRVSSRAQCPPRFTPSPAARDSLLRAEVLPKHQIHLGILPGTILVALTELAISVSFNSSISNTN